MKKLTTEEFICRAREIHGDKYGYDSVSYINARSKVSIKCTIHGIFEQKPPNHINGEGCPDCGKIKRAESKKNTLEEFINRAKEIHGDKYDYSEVSLINMTTQIKIICKNHGEFIQKPSDHLSGHGCRKCTNYAKNTHEQFLEKANKVHNNFYTYPERYKNSKTKIGILCPINGFFRQTPSSHLKGCRHPNHGIVVSKPELEIQKMLKELNIQFETNKRKYIKPYELDMYMPELKKAIEFNGKYWHYSNKFFRPGYHAMKSNLCRDKGIKLLHVREDLWIKDKEKMKEVILKFLNL